MRILPALLSVGQTNDRGCTCCWGNNGPARGLPQVLSPPGLFHGTRGEPRTLISVWVGAIRRFSAPQSRSASLPRHLRSCCSSAPRPAFPRPRRAQQAVRSSLLRGEPSHCAHSCLTLPLLPVRRTRGRGRRRGRHHHRVLRQHPGRRPAPALRRCRAQQAVRSGLCVEKLRACSLV
jgi:hypothetical protein